MHLKWIYSKLLPNPQRFNKKNPNIITMWQTAVVLWQLYFLNQGNLLVWVPHRLVLFGLTSSCFVLVILAILTYHNFSINMSIHFAFSTYIAYPRTLCKPFTTSFANSYTHVWEWYILDRTRQIKMRQDKVVRRVESARNKGDPWFWKKPCIFVLKYAAQKWFRNINKTFVALQFELHQLCCLSKILKSYELYMCNQRIGYHHQFVTTDMVVILIFISHGDEMYFMVKIFTLTHSPVQNGRHYADDNLTCSFCAWNVLYFDPSFTEICSQGSKRQLV